MTFYIMIMWFLIGECGYQLTLYTIGQHYFRESIEDKTIPRIIFTVFGLASLIFAGLLWMCWHED